MSNRPLAPATLLILAVTAGCSTPHISVQVDPGGTPLEGPEPTDYDPAPEPPAIMRDVAMIDDDREWTNPQVPGLRTTMDGRLALRIQGNGGRAAFYLYAPENLNEPIVTAPAGVHLLAAPDPFEVELPHASPSSTKDGHTTLCERADEFRAEGERRNPYACGDDLSHDCYDVTVISSTAHSITSTQMWGTAVTVEIASPKTADAHIIRAEFGEPVAGAELTLTDDWMEPSITNDGRLLTGRVGGFLREWTHPETGEVFQRWYDLMYSVLPEDADPCDVTGWTEFHPMSHAPYDPAMSRYGLAAYPFRDTEGQLIADGEDMGGSYPWVDREGANVFMTSVPGIITEQSYEDFPRRCVEPGCEDYEYARDFDRGYNVAGLWTHGKLVHLDARINNVDWSVGVRAAAPSSGSTRAHSSWAADRTASPCSKTTRAASPSSPQRASTATSLRVGSLRVTAPAARCSRCSLPPKVCESIGGSCRTRRSATRPTRRHAEGPQTAVAATRMRT